MPPEQKNRGPDTNLEDSVAQLLSSLSSTATMVQTLSTEVRGNAVAMAEIKSTVTSMADTVKGLSRVIRGDNGNSLLTRFALQERELASMIEWKKTMEERKVQDARMFGHSMWQLRAALLASGLSFVTAIVVVVLTVVLK